ncbi:MAG: hypothetical protein Ct9H300mP6_11300 [Gammaproteobacteria bacterium]|nr:MAG: hypothetical protein Ct9H300mP6_11300 [Gammaproteobacteria bacterium]
MMRRKNFEYGYNTSRQIIADAMDDGDSKSRVLIQMTVFIFKIVTVNQDGKYKWD